MNLSLIDLFTIAALYILTVIGYRSIYNWHINKSLSKDKKIIIPTPFITSVIAFTLVVTSVYVFRQPEEKIYIANFTRSTYQQDPNEEESFSYPTWGHISAKWGKYAPFGVEHFHYAIDIANEEQTLIYAARSGEIIEMGYVDTGGYIIKIKHSDEFTTLYAHLYKYAEGLKVGDTVKANTVIGYMGKSGKVTGSHLHFEIWKNGERVNPLDYLNVNGFTK